LESSEGEVDIIAIQTSLFDKGWNMRYVDLFDGNWIRGLT